MSKRAAQASWQSEEIRPISSHFIKWFHNILLGSLFGVQNKTVIAFCNENGSLIDISNQQEPAALRAIARSVYWHFSITLCVFRHLDKGHDLFQCVFFRVFTGWEGGLKINITVEHILWLKSKEKLQRCLNHTKNGQYIIQFRLQTHMLAFKHGQQGLLQRNTTQFKSNMQPTQPCWLYEPRMRSFIFSF